MEPSRVISPRSSQAGTRRSSSVRHESASLQATWTELLQHLDQTRPSQANDADVSTDRAEKLDVSRVRRLGQMLISVVNELPDDLLHKVLAALAEELFSATFRDYSFSYDPREAKKDGVERQPSGQSMRLSEESLAQAVPYAAVVGSLREAAKDAIIRRLELEAKIGCNGPETTPCDAEVEQGTARQAKAGEEVRLREELRHARLLAETYQARSLELERSRVELLEEVRRVRLDKEKNDGRRNKLLDEVRRLRSEVQNLESARSARQQEKQEKTSNAQEAAIRASPTPSTRTARLAAANTQRARTHRGTSPARTMFPDEDNSGYPAPSEEELPNSRLRPGGSVASGTSATSTSAPSSSGAGSNRSAAQSWRIGAATSSVASGSSISDGVGSVMTASHKVRRGSDGVLGYGTVTTATTTVASRGHEKLRMVVR